MLKKSLLIVFLLAVAALGTFAAAGESDNCYTVVVGRKASADGSVLVAHNEDDYGDVIVNLRKIAPRDYGAPQKITLRKGAVYETDGKTNGFLWIEAMGQDFADSFVNQYGVVITSDSCPSRETKADVTDGGIGYMLRRIVAEKAVSAKDAVRVASELIERFGYTGSGRTYTFADKDEAWMMAIIRGRHWIAERVPDDEVVVLPNHYIIRGVYLNDTANFAGSADIIDYARANGWYDEAADGPFDFKKAFARPSRRPDPVFDGNTLRHWRGLTVLSGRSWDISDTYPFSFKPGQKVTPESLRALLRDHYEGTEYDATDGYRTGTPNHTKYRTICTSSTINAFVVSLNTALPDPISVCLRLALGKPDTTIFLPLYYGTESLPPGTGWGPSVHDYAALYEQHFQDAEQKAGGDALLRTKVLSLQKLAEADYGPMRERLERDLFPAEKTFEQGRRSFEQEFLSLYSRNKPEALQKLTAWEAEVFKDAGDLYDAILKKPAGSSAWVSSVHFR